MLHGLWLVALRGLCPVAPVPRGLWPMTPLRGLWPMMALRSLWPVAAVAPQEPQGDLPLHHLCPLRWSWPATAMRAEQWPATVLRSPWPVLSIKTRQPPQTTRSKTRRPDRPLLYKAGLLALPGREW